MPVNKTLLHLDLQLTSDADLAAAAAALSREADRRRTADRDLTALHLAHIAAELANDPTPNDPVAMSIEHLELYRNYLLRCTHLSDDDGGGASRINGNGAKIKDTLKNTTEYASSSSSAAAAVAAAATSAEKTHHPTLGAQRTALLTEVLARLRAHPLAMAGRSGDVSAAAAYAGKELSALPDGARRRASGASIIKTPLRRRRQMFSMLFLNFFTGPSIIMLGLALFWYLAPGSHYFFLAYFAYLVYDNRTRKLPTPPTSLWRESFMFRLFRNYFPIRVIKSNEARAAGTGDGSPFDPQGNFLFCYHPHGVQSAGAFILATAASGWDKLFPGLRVSVQTLSINFKVPVFRENCLGLGMGDASKACLTRALTMRPGSCAALVTGGAKESLLAAPYSSKVVLKDRAGFVKLAIRTGAPLVPMWGFGENNVYENMAIGHPWVQKWQRRIQRVISFAPLLVSGRGVFSYTSGLVPHRRPITVVIGLPVSVGPADPNPGPERIREVHERYKQAVRDLHATYKDIYDPKAEPVEMVS